MAVLVLPQELREEGTGHDEDHLVRINLLAIFTGQGYISEVFVLSQFPKRSPHIVAEIVPLQAQLLIMTTLHLNNIQTGNL